MNASIRRLAAIHRDAATHAAWEAFLTDVPMSWLPLDHYVGCAA